MKILLSFIIVFTMTLIVRGQNNINEMSKLIVEEGTMLYRSEMASWYGTDLFLEKFTDRARIGGYFSYSENENAKCVFFSKGAFPKVIGTITFDSTYDTNSAEINLNEREFTKAEEDLYYLRSIGLQQISNDTLFKTYKNTNLNIIPLISNGEKKVYVLTGPTQSGVVIFGNDYLMTYDKDNKLIIKKQIHKKIIPIYYDLKEAEEKEPVDSFHSHTAETGDFITPTDICTLMLYEKFANWKQHTVVSKNYYSFWDCQKNQLLIISKKVIDKIDKDQKKRHKKKNKN